MIILNLSPTHRRLSYESIDPICPYILCEGDNGLGFALYGGYNMDRQRVIYSLCFPSGKFYVGQTVNFNDRMNGHKSDSTNSNKRKYNSLINNAIRKYGWDRVAKKIEQVCSLENVDEWERFYIQAYNSLAPNGYNLESGGNKNKIISDETRKKLSEVHKGKVFTEETRQKMSEARKGMKLSAKTRRKISEVNKGKRLSDETKRKISEAHKGKRLSKEHRQKMSEAHRGEKACWYGQNLSVEHRRKLSESIKAYWRKVKYCELENNNR